MGWKNKKDLRAYRVRRMERGAARGNELERQVETLLDAMKNDGEISDFKKHPHNSREDHQGKDFTVVRDIGGVPVKKHFGVTISLRTWCKEKNAFFKNHVPEFCFPIGTKPETMKKKILGLFNDELPRSGRCA